MSVRKEPVEVNCSSCSARFRLWIPLDGQWENERVNCVRCGAPYVIKRRREGFALEAAPSAAPPTVPPTAPPLQPQPAPPPAAADQDRPVQSQTAPEETPSQPEVRPAEEAQPEPLPSTVLVVEDDGLSRKMVENTLKELDLKVITARNSTEALKAIQEEKIGLLVVDLYLKNPDDPDAVLDGREFLEKAVASGLNVPAIVTTGKEMVDDISLDPRWFELHVKGFVQKGNPFWVDDLKENVKSLLAK